MEKLKSRTRKGISPIIAAVLLIAFTMTIAALFGPWATQTLRDVQESTHQQAEEVIDTSDFSIRVVSANYNHSSNQLEVVVQNTGEKIANETNISVGVIGEGIAKNQIYDLGLKPNEIEALEISLEKTYSVETLKVDLTGYAVSREIGIQCVPNRGLVGYWSFNDEQTENGWVEDLSAQNNNGSLSNLQTGIRSPIGEGYRFGDGSRVEFAIPPIDVSEVTVTAWIKPTLDWSSSPSRRRVISAWDGGGFRADIKNNGNPSYRIGNKTENTETNVNGGSAEFEANEWSFYAGVYNGTTVNDSVDLREHDSVAFSTDSYFPSGTGTIGSSATGRYLIGGLSEIRVYNRSLNTAELERLESVRSEEVAVKGCALTG